MRIILIMLLFNKKWEKYGNNMDKSQQTNIQN